MILGARTGAWAKSSAPLPYDAEVEWVYLSVANEAYLDIKNYFNPNANSEIEIEFKYDISQDIFRAYSSSYSIKLGRYIYYNSDVASCNWTSGNKIIFPTDYLSDFHKYKSTADGELYIDNVFYDSVEVKSKQDFAIFYLGSYFSAQRKPFYVKSFSIYEDGDMKFGLKPVRIGDVGGLYDVVRGGIFTKDSFLPGPDRASALVSSRGGGC